MATVAAKEKTLWRVIVVGGHTRSIGKTQLVCDIILAFPRTEWIAGKITQYGHGVCARNGENCDCAPTEHACALDWETQANTGTDSARFLDAGAKRSFWLRTKQGYLAEGLPLLREALKEVSGVGVQPSATGEPAWELGDRETSMEFASRGEAVGDNTAIIIESNSLMQFVNPSLYFAVIDPLKEDFKQSAQIALDRAQALVLRGEVGEASPAALWMKLPAHLMREKPSVLQRQGEELPKPLWELVHRMLQGAPSTRF